MDKKYQVFVSSTYEDLQEERKKVMEALLKMNCFPVGMEHFNASDNSQWDVIKSIIDECDYYVLIIAGRYGSIDEETGKSYTQKEYEYAIQHDIPVISFIHKQSNKLPKDKCDNKEQELASFKELAKKKLCRYYENADDLASQVVLSLIQLIKTHPRIGLVKASQISTAEANERILKLQEENEKLSKQIDFLNSKMPKGTEDLKQGEDMFTIHFRGLPGVHRSSLFYWPSSDNFGGLESISSIECSWNDIFSSICTLLLNPSSEKSIANVIADNFSTNSDECITKEDLRVILIQLMALKLIDGDNGHWSLTSYGKLQMIKLKALKK
jgi:hypothetical protein